jgi:serine protease Do
MGKQRFWFAGVALMGVAAGAVVGSLVDRESRAHAARADRSSGQPPPGPTPSEVHQAQLLGHTFAQVASRVSPSVVRITVTAKVDETTGGPQAFPFGNPFEGTPFERFFEFRDRKHHGGKPPVERHTGMASGVVVDPRGYILTNNHVVENAERVRVTFVDGKEVAARIIGRDPSSDLAVVKVDKVQVVPARLHNPDDLQVGDWVIAIGNPFGLDHTVTVGVLSAKNRSGFGSGHYEDFLQTDASINPGNSGGPLVDLSGEVIGINTMIAGIGTGIGFAVPASIAQPIADQLIESGKVRRPWLGIAMQDMTVELAGSLGQKAPDQGALVSDVQPHSPAQQAGLRPGDVITAVGGKAVKAARDVQSDILTQKIGQSVTLSIWRAGTKRELEARTAELPETERAAPSPNTGGSSEEKLGLTLGTLTPGLRDRLGLPAELHGALVTEVASGSAAALAGLQAGDVLVEVDHRAVTSAAEAAGALKTRRTGGHLVRVRHGDASLYVVISGE